MQPLRISAKNLGQLALPTFCPRCFWLKLRLGNKLPWQIFPGIFSSIDSFTKRVTAHWLAQHQTTPPWLAGFGELVQSIDPPHWSRFKAVDPATGIELRGVPDHIFRGKDKTLLVIDNKTARFTPGQDALLPLYQVQLNAYAWLAERIGLGQVSAIALVYFEPLTDLSPVELGEYTRNEGFDMPFRAKSLPLALDLKSIPPLLKHVRQIADPEAPPPSRTGCTDCRALDQITDLLAKENVHA
jgi:hypothetical protein